MPIYQSSNGTEKTTESMPLSYINNALRKAREEGNDANIEALESELKARGETATDADANTNS